MIKLFVCKICGEPYLGQNVPDDCPFCGAPKEYIKSIDKYSKIWDTELTEVEEKNMKETLDLEVNATAYYKKVSESNEKYSKYNRLFKQLTRVEKEHAEIAAKFLGINLPEFTGEDPKESIKEDLKRTKELEENATKKYKEFLKTSENKFVKNFFHALIHAEQGHHDFVDGELS